MVAFSSPLSWCWASLFLLLLIMTTGGDTTLCHPQEKTALLHLKSAVETAGGNATTSWGGGDCCLQWDGVTCSNLTTTWRVSKLNFSGDHMSFGSWNFSFSFFTPLHELEVLQLSFHGIGGSLASSDLTGLPKLTYLGLQNNRLTGGIPATLGNLSSLRELRLGDNYLSGSIPDRGLWYQLHQLLVLRIQNNHLNGSLPIPLGGHSLSRIDLSNNRLEGHIRSQSFSNLTSLEYLDLSRNSFEHFPFPSFSNFSKLKGILVSNPQLSVDIDFQHSLPSFQLEALELDGCNLNESFFASPVLLSSQQSIRLIGLSNNNLSGMLPCWIFENKTSLSMMVLSQNSLTGICLPRQPISSVQVIDLGENHIRGLLPSNFSSIFPNLKMLNLAMNGLMGVLSSLSNNTSLTFLDLSDNHFSGQIPAHLFHEGVQLEIVKLSNNNLHGEIPNSMPHSLIRLYLNGNKLTGTFPTNISQESKLEVLDIQDNQISGNLPSSIGGASRLISLVLRNNTFYGKIPLQLCNLTMLLQLDLSHNSFSGHIPSCFHPLGLRYINFAVNVLTGSIPRSFTNISTLIIFNGRNNHLSGNLPSWVGDFQQVWILVLGHNHFQGPIPTQICRLQSLQLLDLSHNNLSKSIPTCITSMTFRKKDLNEDSLSSLGDQYSNGTYFTTGPITLYGYVTPENEIEEVEFLTKGNSYTYRRLLLSIMIGIDLSANMLTGDIPPEIGNLENIKALNLSYNLLTGSIPLSFSKLVQIESLDLSHNGLLGMIPPQLIQLKFLAIFSVAHNNLSGCTPEFKGQFATFNASSYEGNADLHGTPVDKSCNPNSMIPINNISQEDRDVAVVHGLDDIIFYAILAVSFVVFFWGTVGFVLFNRRGRQIFFPLVDRYVEAPILWILLLGKKFKCRRL